MVKHICVKFKKEFNKKSTYLDHINKKISCEQIKYDSQIFLDIPKNSENKEKTNEKEGKW